MSLLLPETRRPAPDVDTLADLCRLTLPRYPGAVISHETAALLWRLPLPQAAPTLLHVTAPARLKHPGLGVATHQAKLRNDDQSWVRGVPVTSPIRTLLDLAATLDELALEQTVDSALNRRQPLTSRDELRARAALLPRTAPPRGALLRLTTAPQPEDASRLQAYDEPQPQLRVVGRVTEWFRSVSSASRSIRGRSLSSC